MSATFGERQLPFPSADATPPGRRASPPAWPAGDAVLQGLDTLAHGIALFDGSGGVRHANVAARPLLARLDTGAPELRQRWLQALQRVVEQGRREMLDLPLGEIRTYAVMVPVPGQGGRLSFVTFGREQLCGPVELQLFALRFGLTPAETTVLRHLVRGLRAADIARQQGVSVTTVLTQLSAIRGKTLFRSVRELLDTLSRMPPLTSVVPVSEPG